MAEYSIDHSHNEASALLGISNQQLLNALGWSRGFWIASDEEKAHHAIAALGHRQHKRADEEAPSWEVRRLKGKRSKQSIHQQKD